MTHEEETKFLLHTVSRMAAEAISVTRIPNYSYTAARLATV